MFSLTVRLKQLLVLSRQAINGVISLVRGHQWEFRWLVQKVAIDRRKFTESAIPGYTVWFRVTAKATIRIRGAISMNGQTESDLQIFLHVRIKDASGDSGL